MKSAVLGLGAMGASMALNLDKAGLLAAVWNRTRATADALAVGPRVLRASTPAEAAAACDLVITCVSRDSDVIEVVRALLPGLDAGAIVVDTSTVSADTAVTLADLVRERGAAFLDCPVSGGVEGARNATLAMMVGGDPKVMERARPALAAIAANIVHMGPTGSGQATKAVNQIMCAGINQAVTEALAFGAAMGLDVDRVIDVVSKGAAGNWFLDKRGRTMVDGTFRPGFKLALHHKDLAICRDMALSRTGAHMPTVDMTLADYEKLMEQGHGDEDISALYRLKKSLLGG